MRITSESDYAIRIVAFMSAANKKTDAQTLSEQTGISLRFTLKILRKLMLSKIISSIKGVNGGYYLSRPSSEISVLDVLTAISGPVAINKCVEHEFECSRPDIQKASDCKIHCFFVSLNNNIKDALLKQTFDQLMPELEKTKNGGKRE